MAGLHAKAYVHMDMNPENMMMFSGRLKVIDVDGCGRAGTKVSTQDGGRETELAGPEARER